MTHRIIDEDKVTKFGGQVFPEFGWCVIIAGGAGSGKGYSFEHFIPIEGRKYDPDELKRLNLKTWTIEEHEIADDELVLPDGERYSLEEVGKPYNLTNKKFTSLVHKIVNPQSKRFKNHIMNQARLSPDGRLPNLIFDLTMNDVGDYEAIIPVMKEMKYKVAIVYVFTDFDVAYKQNNKRSRRVADEIMFKTHKGMFNAFKEIQSRPDLLRMIDEAWIIMSGIKDEARVFNVKSGDKIVFPDERIGQFIKQNVALIRQREVDHYNKWIDEHFGGGDFEWS